MPVLYDSSTDIIHLTGYSEITPGDLDDIYNADVAGSWGQVSKQGNDQFEIDADLEIGAEIQTFTLLALGYVSCVASDIGKMVRDDGVDAGILHDYDNGTRTWEIISGDTVVSGSAMTITGGTGAGTSNGDSTASDETGWFADEAKQLVMGNRNEFIVRTEGHARLGELLDEDEATTANSCMIMMDLTSATDKFRVIGEVEMYGSTFLNSSRAQGMFYLSPDDAANIIRMWNCYVSEIAYTYEYGSFGASAKNWIRSTISNNLYGLNLTTGDFPVEHFNDTLIQGCDWGVRNTWLGYTGDEEITVRNLWIKDSQVGDFTFYNWGTNGDADFYAVDAVCDWVIVFSGGSTQADRSILHRQYTFNLKIVDEDGIPVSSAAVEIWDQHGVKVVDTTTNVLGEITEQVIEYGYYHPTHRVVLSASGYTDCVPSDIGKMTQDDGADAGILVGYDNSLRHWFIARTTTIISGSIMTIPTGTGSGQAAANSSATNYMVERSPHVLKVSKTGYNDIDVIWEMDQPIDWTMTLYDPCYPWLISKINDNAAPGYDHSQVANYPMSWNDGGNILTIWGDDGTGGYEAMGYDADNPITMEEVWAFCAYTKGTCICTKDSDDAFTMKGRLRIGDGTEVTFFASENQSVWLYDYFKVMNNATMRMGSIATDVSNPYPDPKWGATWTIERVTLPDTGNRCYFVEAGGEMYVYDSRIALTDNSRAFDTEIGAYSYIAFSTFAGYDRLDTTYIRWWGVLEFHNMVLHHCRNMNFPTPPDSDSAILNIYDNQNDLQVRDAESWIWDATLSNAIDCACKTLASGAANLVDPVGLDYDKICANLGTWSKLWHRFARKVTDVDGVPIVGARVQLWDKDSVLVYDELTDAQGWTPVGTPADTSLLVLEWQTTGIGSPLTYPTDFDIRGPFTIRISKDGTNNLSSEGEIEVMQRMDTWEVPLVDVSDIVDGIDDIKGTGFVKDTHSLTDIEAYVDAIVADVQSALTAQGYTTGRASNLDNLDAAISALFVAIGNVPTTVWVRMLEGTMTAEQMMRIIFAFAAGITTDDGKEFYSIDQLTKRIDGTMDGKDRTGVVLDGS